MRFTYPTMLSFERLWHDENRSKVLAASGIMTLVIAAIDWWTKPYVSLGFLYLFPIMFAAAFLPRWAVALMGAICAVLAEEFSSLAPSLIRLGFIGLALIGCGLFVAELVRNRRLTIASQARLKVLVETSPAAIVTVDGRGFVELANRAALDLLQPREGSLAGDPIAAFLPELHHALRWEEAPQFRASMQCSAHRGNGEAFLADVWFSTYKEGSTPKLAAIIAEVSDETSAAPCDAIAMPAFDGPEPNALSNRETEVLRLLVQGMANKEIAARIGLSESTVKNTIQQIFGKTGVRTRSQLVRVAMERHRSIL